ncbi:MAG TPA: hypothetical protein VKZ65_07960 [Glycomyces sp.]|nr:hypothetical protein [Glycomyces sp.]
MRRVRIGLVAVFLAAAPPPSAPPELTATAELRRSFLEPVAATDHGPAPSLPRHARRAVRTHRGLI